MSALDSFVESVAFGRRGRQAAPSIGLYLSPEFVCAAETRREKDGRLSVSKLARIAVPSDGRPAATTMSTEFLSDPAKIADLLRRILGAERGGTRRVRVALSHHLGLLRYFPMPFVQRRFLRTAVPIEAKKYIPIPFDALAQDFQTVPLAPDASGKPRLGVLIAVAQKRNIEHIQELLDRLGLEADGVETAPCSVLRLWRAGEAAPPPDPCLQVHMDGGVVRVMICHGGLPVFFREVFLGADPSLADQRRIDLSGCLSFVQKQFGLSTPAGVRVSGSLPDLERWRAAFEQELGVRAELRDEAKRLGIKQADWGALAALGASAHALFPAGVELDLAAKDRVGDEERQAARDIILAGGAAAALLCAAGAFQSVSYGYQARELRRYKVDPQIAATLRGQTPAGMDLLLKDMQSQLDLLSSLDGGKPRLSEALAEIASALPEGAWLERITASNPIGGAERQPFTISLRGRAQGKDVAEEQLLAFQFKDNLLKSPLLGKAFDVQIAVRKESADGGAPEQTRFDVDLRARQ